MALVNVNRKNTDMYYRYKMPKLLAKVEGKGNGIKTVIVNMVEIAKALQRPASYPTKYFGCELGAQTQIDLKNERYIVNGSHDARSCRTFLMGLLKSLFYALIVITQRLTCWLKHVKRGSVRNAKLVDTMVTSTCSTG